MKLLLALFLSLFAFSVHAADANGYTAKYECRASGPNCNVDVATYTTAGCAQTITTSDSLTTIESKLNTGSSPVCITNGDYSAKGTITITASGTSGSRRVLRYTRSGDDDDEPWDQSGANQVKMPQVEMDGAQYWIFHRLSWIGGYAPGVLLLEDTGAANNIFNRLYFTGQSSDHTPDSPAAIWAWRGADYTTFQNSVCSNADVQPDLEVDCFVAENSSHNRFVNNECFNLQKCYFQKGWFLDDNAGSVVENNDVYITTAYYYNGSGVQSPTGNYSASKEQLSMKRGGTSSSNYTKIMNNRVWGLRRSDINACCLSTGGGEGVMITDDSANIAGAPEPESDDYNLILNNIFMDNQRGVDVARGSKDNNSIIGNTFYKIKDHVSQPSAAISAYTGNTFEVYLNTIISSDSWTAPAFTNSDLRCNTIIASGDKATTAGSGTQADYNVFYGTTVWTTESPGSNLGNYTINTRANSTAYSLNDIIRTTATPPEDGTAGDFLYKVTTAGTSAGSPPSYTTTLGATTTDGTMVVQAIRGPLSFYRKLRTSPELVYIPYAKVNTAAPEYGYCPSTFASRSGIGVDNTQP